MEEGDGLKEAARLSEDKEFSYVTAAVETSALYCCHLVEK